MTRTNAKKQLLELEQHVHEFGPEAAARKLTLLDDLANQSLPNADCVDRLHEALCFLRAHPDDEAVLQRVTAMLDGFDRRKDLRRHRRDLYDSGIAGTAMQFPFFADTALWLSKRLPGALRMVWPGYEQATLLYGRLQLLVSWGETPALDDLDWSTRKLVRRLAGPDVSDADFLIQRIAKLGGSEPERTRFFEELEIEFELRLEGGAPSRSRALLPDRPVHYQTAPLRRQRPDLKQELRQKASCVKVDEREGARIIALARDAMVVRHRDLDAFAYGDARDVRLYDCGDGLEFAVVGVKPEKRLLLEAVYAYLTLKNGVPIGYVLTSGLFQSSEVAYNVFETWRGGEAGLVYGQALSVTRDLFGADTFTIYPYQLGGSGNREGLESGSWWFYQKLGFRARDPQVLASMQRELQRMAKRKGYRTPIKTLAELAEHNVYWPAEDMREDVIGVFPLAGIGLAITDYLAGRFGIDRERGERVCATEAAQLCGVRGWQKWPAGERLWWRRWSPLLLILPGIDKWTAAERRALVAVVRAKGSTRESDYVRLLDGHERLRAALRKLAATPL